jgi:hypothetical protein
MSLASEIRAAVTQFPNRGAEELWRHCPSARNLHHFSNNLYQFVFRKEVIAVPGTPRRYRMNTLFVAGREKEQDKPLHRVQTLISPKWEQTVRPGGLDYRQIPSMQGGKRIPYHLP